MPAAVGRMEASIPAPGGGLGVAYAYFFDPATGLLRDNPTPWTSPDGTVWLVGTGALIADNHLTFSVWIRVNDDNGQLIRQIKLLPGGRGVKAAALAAQTPAFVSKDDFLNLTFDIITPAPKV